MQHTYTQKYKKVAIKVVCKLECETALKVSQVSQLQLLEKKINNSFEKIADLADSYQTKAVLVHWPLLCDINDEGAHKLRVTDTKGVGGGGLEGDGTLLRAVSPWSGFLGGV